MEEYRRKRKADRFFLSCGESQICRGEAGEEWTEVESCLPCGVMVTSGPRRLPEAMSGSMGLWSC